MEIGVTLVPFCDFQLTFGIFTHITIGTNGEFHQNPSMIESSIPRKAVMLKFHVSCHDQRKEIIENIKI